MTCHFRQIPFPAPAGQAWVSGPHGYQLLPVPEARAWEAAKTFARSNPDVIDISSRRGDGR